MTPAAAVLAVSWLLAASGIARTGAAPVDDVLDVLENEYEGRINGAAYPLGSLFVPIDAPSEQPDTPSADRWHDFGGPKPSFRDLFPPANNVFSGHHQRYSVYVPAFDAKLKARFDAYDDQEHAAAGGHGLTSESAVDKSQLNKQRQVQPPVTTLRNDNNNNNNNSSNVYAPSTNRSG